ncbi:glycosyl hydrolase family 10 protein / carbohydrate-binding domain-containing protein [Perilla frutescens var. hirtella]|uniref:Glycosyl hydrolase family 10 protein / carbohydrate-binding domain-containing protein n=1 Tax=Perilla frutescens var. hirtella TaxID=608512 RepID=A0AAD4J1I5_PERFH|nr:glycosyl hydrolase family 10 protein / carbohydrate-binding domain-containing protein [Perilla frutescens var. hirtella]
MGRFLNCCFTIPVAGGISDSKRSIDIMERPSSSNANGNSASENSNEELNDTISRPATNVILNHDFSGGLHLWHPNSCDGYVASSDSGYPQGLSASLNGRFAVVTNRKECWQGLEQDITNRISAGSTYTVCAWVGISGSRQGVANVQATLKLEYQDSSVSYLFIGRTCGSVERFEKIEGTFCLSTMPHRVTFYVEGPPPGIDILIRSVVVSCPDSSQYDTLSKSTLCDDEANIILNPGFDDGLNNWSGRGCKIVLNESMAGGKILPQTGKYFASTVNRTQNWNGIQQEITGRVQRKLAYEVVATVRIFGNVGSADVRATLWVQAADLREQYIGIASVQATDKDWVQLHGKFLLNNLPSKVVIYFEGPPPGTDILLNNLVVKHAAKAPPASPPVIENAAFGVNIIANSNLTNGTKGWFPLGNCTLSVGNGSPHILPPMAEDSLGPHEPLSGSYILVTNRTQTWMGPAQTITEKVELYLTYQVSAWVRIGTGATKPQGVNVALGVDSQWVNGGQVEINDDKWHEIGGSFRIEKQPTKIIVYIQGPDPGIDLMVAGLQIFPVNRPARFKYLKKQTDKIRKRDVILKFTRSDSGSLFGTFVKIRQTQNSFPFGSCINRTNIDNEDFVDFFVKNFNWAVFGNELKWYWTEPQKGNFNYKDADDLLNLCSSHNIQLRGHCIFWEVEATVQSWIRALSKNDLMIAVQNRLRGLLTRYKGMFKHYDVNNEMLHGSFYQDRLGKDIRANMFKIANQLDPSATLFVNDYHVEDGCDSRSSPEKYIQHILDLQEQGAPVGGVGIQGHIDNPVGPIVCSALNKLGILGLPIWFTELDFSSSNEYVRADDLEVMIREAYAHPAVEGVILWGFWELFMSRDSAHLVNAEGDINAAGLRFLALKEEWLSKCHGLIDEQDHFEFRGFHGSYEVDIVSFSQEERVTKRFVVEPGEDPLVVTINL